MMPTTWGNSLKNFSTPIAQSVFARYQTAPFWMKVCGGLCAFVAAEAALSALGDLLNVTEKKSALSNRKGHLRSYNFSANAGTAIFYGLCAARPLSLTPLLGATIFSLYSCVMRLNKEAYANSYLSTQVVAETLLCGGRFFKTLTTKLAFPLIENVLEPLVEKVARATNAVLRAIPLHKHPIWVAVSLLGGAILGYKLIQEGFKQVDRGLVAL